LQQKLFHYVGSSKLRPSYLQATPTLQKFFLVVNLVQMKPVEELVAKLRRGKVISKERVIQESKPLCV
jgi:hypothetical protein